MKVYYAHCLAIYHTPQENRDVITLMKLGFDIVNPNTPEIQARCDDFRARGIGKQVMEEIFRPMVEDADVIAFRALPDGRIPAGVAKELDWAKLAGLPIIELPTFAYDRKMTLDATLTYLQEVGQR